MDGSFAGKLLNCVDKALDLFGKDVKPVVYWRWKEEYGFSREEIPFHIDKFESFIHEMFGIGAGVVEAEMLRAIREEFSLSSSEAPDFRTAVSNSRRKYLSEQWL